MRRRAAGSIAETDQNCKSDYAIVCGIARATATMCSAGAKHVMSAGVGLASCTFAMISFERGSAASSVNSSDPHAASAHQALVHWRAAFDQRLEALERALRDPTDVSELSTLIVDFTRVAGEEAEAAARQAALEAQLSARPVPDATDEDRRALEEARGALADARRQHQDARQALDATRRAHEETRRAHDETRRAYDQAVRSLDDTQRALQDAHREIAEARRLVADAETQTQQADEERRELVGIQAQLQGQLEDARVQAHDAAAQCAALREEVAEATREAEARGRELQTFRRRLEQAVHDAEERSRAQEAERARFQREAAEATGRATALERERDDVRQEVARAQREIEQLRLQVDASAARISALDQEIVSRDRLIERWQQDASSVACSTSVQLPEPSHATERLPATTVPTEEWTEPEPNASSAAAVEESEVSADAEASSEAMPWLQSPEAVGASEPSAVLATAPLETAPVAAVDVASVDPAEEPAEDDPPLSPESTGVFSTVADALRAWTIETVAPGEAGPQLPAAGAHAGSSGGDTEIRPDAPQYDVVRQSFRHHLAARQIEVRIDQEPGHLVDLSVGGAQVVTASMLKPGRQVRVTFPAAGPLAVARAKIAWSRLEPPTHGGGELQYRAGLTFVKIDAKTIERVIGR